MGRDRVRWNTWGESSLTCRFKHVTPGCMRPTRPSWLRWGAMGITNRDAEVAMAEAMGRN